MPNHLASGADEGEICIWDIAHPAKPTHFPPLKVCIHGVNCNFALVVSYLVLEYLPSKHEFVFTCTNHDAKLLYHMNKEMIGLRFLWPPYFS